MTSCRALVLGALALAPVELVATVARADSPLDTTATNETTPALFDQTAPTRRAGFLASVDLGGGVASISGYPNDVRKIGVDRYHTSSGALGGANETVWIGGALTDYFNFGLGLTFSELVASNDKIQNVAFLFRLEGFPLFWKGGAWRDLGAIFTAGTGGVTLAPKSDPSQPLVDGGATSMIGGGVFFEGIRFSRFAMGPFALANYFWSQSVERPAVFAGWRAVVYAGKIKK